MWKRFGAAAAAALLLCGAAPAPKTVIYTHVNLIDGTGAPLQADMAIVTRDDTIVDVVSAGGAKRITAVKGAVFVDMHGAYALPGLINTHLHMATVPDRPFAEASLRRALYSGVTAIRDMAGDGRALADLARSARYGDFPAPDIYYVALVAGPEFFKDPRTIDSTRGLTPGEAPWMRAIAPQTNLSLAIAEARGTSATAIKIYADLPPDLVAAVTAEAHRQKLLVWAHAAVFPAAPLDVVAAGVDVVSHVCMLGYQASDKMPPAYHHRAPVDAAKLAGDSPMMDALYAEMKRRGTVLDATVYVYEVISRLKNATPPPYCTLQTALKLTHDAHKAGVEISTGTDDDAAWNKPFTALTDEMAYLVKAGFTPLEAIRAATLIGARAAGQEKIMGSIEKGKLANLVFLGKNPLVDITNVNSVTLTVKRGAQFWRKNYKPVTKIEAKNEM